jgi:hypothetical protein
MLLFGVGEPLGPPSPSPRVRVRESESPSPPSPSPRVRVRESESPSPRGSSLPNSGGGCVWRWTFHFGSGSAHFGGGYANLWKTEPLFQPLAPQQGANIGQFLKGKHLFDNRNSRLPISMFFCFGDSYQERASLNPSPRGQGRIRHNFGRKISVFQRRFRPS